MKVTVTTTTQKLTDLLSATDFDLIRKGCGSASPYGKYLVLLRNTGANTVYVELYKDATTTDGISIASGNEISFSVNDLSKVNLIASVGNSDVNLMVTT